MGKELTEQYMTIMEKAHDEEGAMEREGPDSSDMVKTGPPPLCY
jgi:hypothetical protein